MPRGLAPVGIAPNHARVVRTRVAPMINHFWTQRGFVSVEELCMSCYIQGFMDSCEVQSQHKTTMEEPVEKQNEVPPQKTFAGGWSTADSVRAQVSAAAPHLLLACLRFMNPTEEGPTLHSIIENALRRALGPRWMKMDVKDLYPEIADPVKRVRTIPFLDCLDIDLLPETAYVAGSKVHVEQTAIRWIIQRQRVKSLDKNAGITPEEKLNILEEMAEEHDSAEAEFWEAARKAIAENACVPPPSCHG